MGPRRMTAGRASNKVVAVLLLALAAASAVVIEEGSTSQPGGQAQPRMESSIFSYDGKDFVRTRTTLTTEDGTTAVNTKLEHDTPAYKALIKKHSYVGEVTVFGHKYDADYAPLVSDDGRLTGALFVGVEKTS